MQKISAQRRYEIDGKTVLFIPEYWMTVDNLAAIESGELITFSALNENDGKHARNIGRSIMIPKKIERIHGGYYLTVELDLNSMPSTRRALDGY